jgi:hypothetical protein
MARAEDFSRVWLTGISSSSPCLSCLKHEHVPQFLLGFFAGVFGPFFGGLAWRDPFAIRRRFLNDSRKDLSATTLRKWCMRSTPRGGAKSIPRVRCKIPNTATAETHASMSRFRSEIAE